MLKFFSPVYRAFYRSCIDTIFTYQCVPFQIHVGQFLVYCILYGSVLEMSQAPALPAPGRGKTCPGAGAGACMLRYKR